MSPTLTRRAALFGAAASSAALAIPAVAAVAPQQTPEERIKAAIAELQAALEAVDPGIAGWLVINPVEKPGCTFVLQASSTPFGTDRPDMLQGRTTGPAVAS